MQFTIIGRRWFERVNGNTYHSVEVYKNGELLERVPFQYGYGDMYNQTAAEIIAKHCPRIWKNVLKNNPHACYGSDVQRYGNHKATRSVTDVQRKKDL